MSKTQPWTLPKLMQANRNAATVYAALRWLAGERRQLSTTRRAIRAVCGLAEDTISAAMSALDKARWVRVGYGRFGNRSWYRLVFPVAGFFPCAGKKAAQGQAREPAKRQHREAVPCTGKKAALPLKGGRAVPVAPSPALPGSGATPAQNLPEHPAARIERERLASIRAAREADEVADLEPAPSFDREQAK